MGNQCSFSSVATVNPAANHLVGLFDNFDEFSRSLSVSTRSIINSNVDEEGSTIFYCACRDNKLNIVQLMLTDKRVKTNLPHKDGFTPFYIACQRGNTEIVKLLLLNKDIQINRVSNQGFSPFYAACSYGKKDVVELLLRNKKIRNIDTPRKENKVIWATPFYAACEFGHDKVVELLLNDGRINPNFQFKEKEHLTPLYIASRNGHPSVVKLLLQRSAPSSWDLWGIHGPLRVVFEVSLKAKDSTGYADVISLYFKQYPHLRTSDSYVEECCLPRYLSVLRDTLLADPNFDPNSTNCLKIAVSVANNDKMVALLLDDKRIDVNRKLRLHNNCDSYYTPLKYAAAYAIGLSFPDYKATCEDRVRYVKLIMDHPKFEMDYKALHALCYCLSTSSYQEEIDGMMMIMRGMVLHSKFDPTNLLVQEGMNYFSTRNNALTKAVLELIASAQKMRAPQTPTFSSPPEMPTGPGIIPYKELSIGRVLGQGGFGFVSEAIWQNATKVAVKQLLGQTLPENIVKEFHKEAENHSRLRHPNIVTLYGVCIEPMKYALVMELMNRGTLFNLLHSSQDLPWVMRVNIALDVASGILYLHGQQVLHRDLKSLNVLLDDNGRAKLSDFGLSKVKTSMNTATAGSTGGMGTVRWMAPELFDLDSQSSKAADIFAFAIVLWEIAKRKLPYENMLDNSLIIQCLLRGQREKIPETTPESFSALITRCWDQRAENRPKIDEVVREMQKIKSTF